ncbi:hypothetical protein Pyn_02371 [Prunus yedoensis var. nudiflora]|uniref:Uncharacterized protein n=1 Tax=Prunus yedoensis var. nudiflora TaxID=2094558 RepID=A0A314Z4Q4_PRUYE|nr:hypothetical protein Pyn_02371 [Prunus yedoensis var. nudiflora]
MVQPLLAEGKRAYCKICSRHPVTNLIHLSRHAQYHVPSTSSIPCSIVLCLRPFKEDKKSPLI